MIALVRESLGSNIDFSSRTGRVNLMKDDTFSPAIPWPSATAKKLSLRSTMMAS